MTTLTSTEMQAASLDRARNSQSLANYPAVYQGFIDKGISFDDIKPRENVLTFNAWKALGRSVKKGEHGVKVVTFISVRGKEEANGEESNGYRMPKTTTVFHITQTELSSEREARHASQGKSENRVASKWQRRADEPAKHVAAPLRDPGEDASDRWIES